MNELFELQRELYLFDYVDADTVLPLIQEINRIGDHDALMEETLKSYEREPIILHINSGGGSATDGFALISAIKASKTPVVGVASGMVASMALAIYAACDYRLVSRYARLLYHSVGWGAEGLLQDHIDVLEESRHTQRMYDKVVLNATNLTKDDLKAIQQNKKDFIFGAKKALKIGLAHDLYEDGEDEDETAEGDE